MTVEEEADLVRRAQGGCRKATEEIILMHTPYVWAMARKMMRYQSSSEDIKDLVQEGTIGLVRAIPKFETKRGWRFLTYANWWVQSAMYDFAFRNARLVKFTMASEVRRVSTTMPSALAALGLQNDDIPEHAEKIAEHLGTTKENVLIASVYWQRDISTSRDRTGDDLGHYPIEDQETIREAGEASGNAEENMVARIVANGATDLIREAIARLPQERYREVFEHRILAQIPLTLSDLGKRFNVTRERARQIEKEAMRLFLPNLRRLMAIRGLKPADLFPDSAVRRDGA
jgi:RNA polymerase sigma-32 factor